MELSLVIRTLDDQEVQVSTNSNATISDLKVEIEEHTNIPIESQRLLHQGKLLRDNTFISETSLQNSSEVFLVSYLTHDYDLLLDIANLIATPAESSRRTVSSGLITETLVQTMHTIDDLLCTRESQRRSFRVGQWVDVKDTVDQWLEAQVLEVRSNGSEMQAFVHYNGWPERWDEWVSFDSPRIMPFRTYTKQPTEVPLQSPMPAVSPEVRSTGRHSVEDIVMKGTIYLELMKELLHKRSPVAQSPAIMDRVGRMLSDLSKLIICGRRVQVPPISSNSGALSGIGVEVYLHSLML